MGSVKVEGDSQKSRVPEAEVAVLAQDHVVVKRDVQNLARLGERARHLAVLPARRGVAGGVVVGDDDRGRVQQDRRLVDLTRVDDRGVDRPDRHDVVAQKDVPGIQAQDHELLAVAVA